MLVKNFSASAADWDEFAQQVGASFRCAYHAGWAWQLEHHVFHRLWRLEIFDVEGECKRKIAQCAIGIGLRWRVFGDSLQIAREDDERWSKAMTAIMEYCGPGRYIYGSDWSMEPSRELVLNDIKGVILLDVQHTTLQLVDFRDYETWDNYYQALSPNVRRNVEKFKRFKSLSSRIYIGGLKNLVYLHAIRYRTYRRKSLSKHFSVRLIRALLRSAALSKFYDVWVVRSNRHTLAAYGGVRFGLNTFFLEGGSAAKNHGASWRLLTLVMERAWRDSSGKGVFVLGSDDGTQAGSKAWEGLSRSRTACRAKGVRISIVRLDFRPKSDPASNYQVRFHPD